MRGLINHDIYMDKSEPDTTYQRILQYTIPNRVKTHKFSNDHVSIQTDNVFLNSPVQEKIRMKHHDQQTTHFKLWDDHPSPSAKLRSHNYGKTNFELNDYRQPEPRKDTSNIPDKRNSNEIFALLGQRPRKDDQNSDKKKSTQESYVNNVKKLFDSFYQPPEVKKHPEYPNGQNNDQIMKMNGSSIDALENGKESLKEDLGVYFASKGGSKKIKERTQQVPAQADNIATLKCHQEE